MNPEQMAEEIRNLKEASAATKASLEEIKQLVSRALRLLTGEDAPDMGMLMQMAMLKKDVSELKEQKNALVKVLWTIGGTVGCLVAKTIWTIISHNQVP